MDHAQLIVPRKVIINSEIQALDTSLPPVKHRALPLVYKRVGGLMRRANYSKTARPPTIYNPADSFALPSCPRACKSTTKNTRDAALTSFASATSTRSEAPVLPTPMPASFMRLRESK